MKIISKFKDYYDYLVGYYGRDETIVYDRRNKNGYHPSRKWRNGRYKIYFCGQEYRCVVQDNRVIYDYKEFPKHEWYSRDFLNIRQGRTSDINKEKRQPVLCEEVFGQYFIPHLSEFNFVSQVSAEQAFMDIYQFLGWLKDNPEAPQITDNNCKIKAAGFDTRTSFRPKMKKRTGLI